MSDEHPAETPDDQTLPGSPGSANEPGIEAPADEGEPAAPAEARTGHEPGREVRAAEGWGRRNVIGAAVAMVLVLALVWWGWRSGSDGEARRTPSQTVAEFFAAQDVGDCELVLDLVTEASWSQDGERSRAEFLDQCAAALVGYRPVVDEVTVEPGADGSGGDFDDVDEALVTLTSSDSSDEEGSLRRDGGGWRVEADAGAMTIGRSVDDTMHGYIDAYNAGDCATMRRFLAEATWSQDGELSDDEFAERCAEVVGDRSTNGGDEPRPVLVSLGQPEPDEPDEHDPDRAIAPVEVGQLNEPALVDRHDIDEVMFVREGLSWQLAGVVDDSGGVGGAPVAAPVPEFAWVGLQDRLVDEVVLAGDRCSHFQDHPARHPTSAKPLRGVVRDFAGCSGELLVTLRTFDDDAAALAAAEDMVAEQLPASASMTHAEAPVPGLDDALGVSSTCVTEGCGGSASAYAVRDGVLASVIVTGDMGDAATILRAQLERL